MSAIDWLPLEAKITVSFTNVALQRPAVCSADSFPLLIVECYMIYRRYILFVEQKKL
jgi:hypothetical protein